MGQNEILDFLNKYSNEWFDTVQISEAIGVNIESVNKNLAKLKHNNLVSFKSVRTEKNQLKFVYSSLTDVQRQFLNNCRVFARREKHLKSKKVHFKWKVVKRKKDLLLE